VLRDGFAVVAGGVKDSAVQNRLEADEYGNSLQNLFLILGQRHLADLPVIGGLGVDVGLDMLDGFVEQVDDTVD
jgi:hypothetical protein